MSHSVFCRKIISAVLIIGMVGLSLVLASCTGPQGPVGAAGPPGPQGVPGPSGSPGSTAPEYAAQVKVSPDVVELTAKTIEVYGSGFIPNRGVSLGLRQSGKTLPLLQELANEHGAFRVKIEVSALTFYKVQPGIYTLLAESKDGPRATAPLVIQEAKK